MAGSPGAKHAAFAPDRNELLRFAALKGNTLCMDAGHRLLQVIRKILPDRAPVMRAPPKKRGRPRAGKAGVFPV